MGRRPKWGREVHGVLLLNKDSGVTSNTALQQVKRLFFAKRAGHTGSLDPLATGVLPICLGEATKFSQYLLDADKCYESTYRFGVTTETGDCDGNVVAQAPAPHVTAAAVEEQLSEFRGDITQVPSIYSALKFQGKPLYQWAREGKADELPLEARQPRQITVYSYELLAFREGDYPEVDVRVHCSKGTYIRTLAEDLGQRLGCGAHVIRLHRTQAGPFVEKDAITLEELQQVRSDDPAEVLDQYLLPVDRPLAEMSLIEITDDMGEYFCQGQPVMSSQAYRSGKEGDMVRVYSESGDFLGVAVLSEGNIAPKRIVNFSVGPCG